MFSAPRFPEWPIQIGKRQTVVQDDVKAEPYSYHPINKKFGFKTRSTRNRNLGYCHPVVEKQLT